MFTVRRLALLSISATLALGLVACSSDGSSDDGTSTSESASAESALVVYSGRGEELVDPLIERIGGGIEVDYSGNTNAQAAKILEEGDATPADVFYGQDAGALGALDEAGALAPLPEDILSLVPEQYRGADGTWVATSARARVLAYNSDSVQAADLPTGIDGLLDPRWRGQIGYAPTNASFQAFVTALRVQRGEDGARTWLEGFVANEPVAFEGNGPLLTAVNDGQVATGLLNHYYWYPFKDENGDDAPVELHYFEPGDPGALINVAGAGVLAASDNQEAAFDFVRELLSTESQTYFANETAEYPVIDGVTSDYDLPPLSELGSTDLDLGRLSSLEATQTLLTDVGII
ncbi:iron ABC transporter substrate-binding protein [Rhodococcus sp. 06-470-2]|uniref:iron ABC transporter substrate-binding protein n=1 Tax=Nocardiaceae TaxID=85025 RepID=UPI0005D82E93|nr:MULTISPECIES: iron ABC transporter substrate-binding protein [Rhodococcus]AJW40685.1 Ferric iron ABC transporter, iron-binding protein [Rhodococcus sp. B7740]OZC68072.1 iron ABC transporter substrate-binding protein [Rhodococcus sp. 06-470-2]OZD85446.1 iron ABC transporter substrate-binding protein [Rhodococcus sp. 05-339-2]OZE62591.1 iron ABC transporter substrate-binding protein [Rhodococcus sp. 05-2221-1B]OZE62618.1 iron ABC transporter substrate-binding protein [Rhodococcus sp. 05-2221-